MNLFFWSIYFILVYMFPVCKQIQSKDTRPLKGIGQVLCMNAMPWIAFSVLEQNSQILLISIFLASWRISLNIAFKSKDTVVVYWKDLCSRRCISILCSAFSHAVLKPAWAILYRKFSLPWSSVSESLTKLNEIPFFRFWIKSIVLKIWNEHNRVFPISGEAAKRAIAEPDNSC